MQDFKNMTKEEFKKLNNGTFFWKNGYNVILSCKYIQSWEQFAEALGNAFQFPMRNEAYAGTQDWMEDLTWLGKQENIRIYLCDWKELLKKDKKAKENVVMLFYGLIHWWKEDVKECFIEGKPGEPKEFEVILID